MRFMVVTRDVPISDMVWPCSFVGRRGCLGVIVSIVWKRRVGNAEDSCRSSASN